MMLQKIKQITINRSGESQFDSFMKQLFYQFYFSPDKILDYQMLDYQTTFL